MENKYMFICPNCKETFSSDKDHSKECPNCGTQLEKMRISVAEWRELNDDQKQLRKDNELAIIKTSTKGNNSREIIRIISYLLFHSIIFFIPIAKKSEIVFIIFGLIASFAVFWWARPSLEEWKENCIKRKWMYLTPGIWIGLTGIFSGSRSNYSTMYNYNTKQTAYYFFISAILLVKGLYSIYLSKNQNPDKIVANSQIENSSVLKNNKDNSIRYCRKCGAELFSDSMFCRKCGTKVIE